MTTHFRSFQRGFSMTELMVSIGILAIVFGIGIPNFTTWISNTQVRSTAESLLAAIQLARGEAVKQNSLAQFKLTGDATGSASWSVIAASSSVSGSFNIATDKATSVQTAGASETGANARLGVSTAAQANPGCCAASVNAGTNMGTNPQPGIVFDAFGKVVADTSVTTVTRIDVTKVGDTGANDEEKNRRMVILISDSGMAKLCRPSLPASNSQGCP